MPADFCNTQAGKGLYLMYLPKLTGTLKMSNSRRANTIGFAGDFKSTLKVMVQDEAPATGSSTTYDFSQCNLTYNQTSEGVEAANSQITGLVGLDT
jgi:hypothetical protein